MKVYSQGSLYKVVLQERRPGWVSFFAQSRIRKKGSKRGKVCGFSERSRARLLRFLAKVKFNGALFVTLTSRDDVTYSRLTAFSKRLLRRYGTLPIVWRKELQARGVYHYHLIIFSRIWLPVEFVISAWGAVVGEPGSVSVRFVDNSARLYHYVSKYLGKVDRPGGGGVTINGHTAADGVAPGRDDALGVESDEGAGILDYTAISCRGTGRIWGALNRQAFVFYAREEVSLEDLPYAVLSLLWKISRYIVENGYTCDSFEFVCFAYR